MDRPLIEHFLATLRPFGRVLAQPLYLVAFVGLLFMLLALLLIAVCVGPVVLIAWMLARFLYWLLTSIVIAFNPDNWSRLHRCPPYLNFLACIAIGMALWYPLRHRLDEIATAYAGFMLGTIWPFFGWMAPLVDRLDWIQCVPAASDSDPCKETALAWISSPQAGAALGIALAAIWWGAIFATYLRVGGEARRVCMIERAP